MIKPTAPALGQLLRSALGRALGLERRQPEIRGLGVARPPSQRPHNTGPHHTAAMKRVCQVIKVKPDRFDEYCDTSPPLPP